MVDVDKSKLNELRTTLPIRNKKLIKTLAFRVESLAKLKSPVDTGANRASIYTATEDNNPGGVEANLPNPPKDTAYIGPTMEYSVFLEFGTSRQAAQPFLLPALREVESQLNAETIRELLL